MWAVAAVAAVTALAQWLNSDQARQASRKERKKIEALYEKLQLPTTRPEDLKPEEYQVLETYTPEVAPYVAEAAPQVVQQTEGMRQGRTAQLDALTQMRQAALAERDPALMAMLEGASARSAADAQGQREATLAAMQRRGQLGSGMELAAQLQGSASAMSRGAEEGRQAAIEAYRNRMAAARSSADIGRGLYSQEEGTQRTNADIINAFNQRAASAQRSFLGDRASALNEATRINMAARQKAADANINLRNKYKQDIADLEQQKFVNERAVTGDRAGLAREQIANVRQNAQDRAQAIQGLGDVGMAYYGGEQDMARQKELQQNEFKHDEEMRQKYGYRS